MGIYRHPPTSFENNSFTLIEMLVVIAIISILASLVLPAFNSAHKLALTIACENKLHQLSLSFSSYSNDYSNKFPRMRWVGLTSGADTWTAMLGNNGYFNKDLLWCPAREPLSINSSINAVYYYSWRENANALDMFYTPRFPEYGYNQILGPTSTSGKPMVSVSKVKNPSKTIQLGDTIAETRDRGNYYCQGSYGSGNTNVLWPIHGFDDTINILFVDGHSNSISSPYRGNNEDNALWFCLYSEWGKENSLWDLK